MNNKAKKQLQAIISKMTFPQALCMSKGLNDDYDVASKAMEVFPRGEFGLIPDDVKATLEFKDARFAYDAAFENLRNFNGVYTKQYKVELAEIRKEKRAKIATYKED